MYAVIIITIVLLNKDKNVQFAKRYTDERIATQGTML